MRRPRQFQLAWDAPCLPETEKQGYWVREKKNFGKRYPNELRARAVRME